LESSGAKTLSKIAAPEKSEEAAARPARSPKASPAPSEATPEKTRLWISAGENIGLAASDVVNAIMGETGLPAKTVGKIDIRERHVFVDVDAEHARSIISKLNRGQIKGQKVKVKVA